MHLLILSEKLKIEINEKKRQACSCRFGAKEGTFVKTISVIESNALHLIIITTNVSPLKNCRTVVRQFLYLFEGSSP